MMNAKDAGNENLFNSNFNFSGWDRSNKINANSGGWHTNHYFTLIISNKCFEWIKISTNLKFVIQKFPTLYHLPIYQLNHIRLSRHNSRNNFSINLLLEHFISEQERKVHTGQG
jgi:hypothetical protein